MQHDEVLDRSGTTDDVGCISTTYGYSCISDMTKVYFFSPTSCAHLFKFVMSRPTEISSLPCALISLTADSSR